MKKNYSTILNSNVNLLKSKCVFLMFILVSASVFSQEDCGNGIDDDNDGLIDCLDPDCKSGIVPTATTFNTGTNGIGGTLPGGSDDNNWTVSIGALNGTYLPAKVLILGPIQGGYATSAWPDCAWIGHSTNGSHGGLGNTDFYYKVEFFLPCFNQCNTPYSDSAAFCLNMDFFADNSIAEVYINGIPQSPSLPTIPNAFPYSWAGFWQNRGESISLCKDWRAGRNILIIKVASGPGYAGFLAQNSIVIPPPTNPTLTTNINSVICNGQSYTLPGGSVVSVTGSYSDTLVSFAGCDSIVTTNLNVINAVNTSQNPLICLGQNYTLPNNQIVSIAGIYIDTLTSAIGCDSIVTTNLSIISPVNTTQNPTICTGQSYTLPSNQIVNTPGSYIDTLQSSIGCDSIVTTNLNISAAITSIQNPIICQGANFTLPSNQIVNTAGTYIDTVKNSGGCDSIVTTNLSISAAITSTQNPILCQGVNFILPSNQAVNTAGTYIDTVQNSGGCDSIITTNLTYNPTSSSSQSHIMCLGESYTLPNNQVVLLSGVYTSILVNYKGCDSVVTTTLTVNPKPLANTIPSNVITTLPNNSTTITASGGLNYIWFPTTNLSPTTGSTVTATPSETTTYCVEVTDANNCKDTTCITIQTELPCPTIENFQVPNAFSPNNDNINDEFCIQGWDPCIEDFLVVIYDRWGEKVFESIDPNFCWDGSFKNKIMEAQVFVYFIQAIYENDEIKITKQGNISLIR